MAGGVTLQIRQIGSYPLVGAAGPGDLLLMQPGGLGNPYASVDAATLVSTALNSGGSLAAGIPVPPNDAGGGVFSTYYSSLPGAGLRINMYDSAGASNYLRSAPAAWFDQDPTGSLNLAVAGPGAAQAPITALTTVFSINLAGAATLPRGTLTVARDPGAPLEVATMGWVGNNTVASFNGRRGIVQLTTADIYGALCLDSCIATENWVNSQIQASLQLLLANHPFVFGWNGRIGAVYLTLADISCVFFQPGQQPITQTPPLTSNDYSIPNTAWVVEYIANEFAGGGSTLATQAWVLANTVNSFNGRQGVVTLTSSDVFDVGAAPLNSPAFSGIPTAPTAAVGQATGQIATTAFVQQAITNNTAGVSTFNTRSGDVVLETADVTGVGGLVNPSPNLTGNPTAPTQPPGTNLPVIATCEFVQAALASGAVTSFNTRTGAVTLTLADVTGVGGAPLVSPAFSSVPTAPTAAPGTNTVQLATTAFVTAAVTAAGGVSSFNSRTGAVTLVPNDISAAGGLVNPSVGLTGSPTATTATAGDNSTRIATTAFVQTALSSGAVTSFNTRTGAVTLQGADITAAGGALLASPAFTGAPTAPTAAPATNNTQIATTAYVTAAILADTTGVTSFNTRTGAVVLTTADITGAGGAPLASPSFTGVPLGPTATAGTSTTQLATTAFVQNAIASSGVSSFNARTGAVTLIANDISAAGGALLASPTFTGTPAAPTPTAGNNSTNLATTAFVQTALATYAPLASPTFTGVPAAPTATAGTNTTQLATTAFVTAAIGALGTGPFLPLAGGTLTGALNGTTGVFSGTLNGGNGTIGGTSMSANNATVPGTLTAANVVTTNNFSGPATYQMVASGSGILNIATNGIFPSLNDSWSCGAPGQAWFQVAAYAFPNESDPRLKADMTPAPAGAIAAVNAVGVYTFKYKTDPTGATHTGFDATEVRQHHPHAVMEGEDEAKTLAVNLPDMIAKLWQAVQELSAEVASLKGAAA